MIGKSLDSSRIECGFTRGRTFCVDPCAHGVGVGNSKDEEGSLPEIT
jgi:hypothetical protein